MVVFNIGGFGDYFKKFVSGNVSISGNFSGIKCFMEDTTIVYGNAERIVSMNNIEINSSINVTTAKPGDKITFILNGKERTVIVPCIGRLTLSEIPEDTPKETEQAPVPLPPSNYKSQYKSPGLY